MNYALLLHLPLTDYPILRRFGIAATQTLSWNSENMNKEGLAELFYQVGAVEKKEIRIIDVSGSAEGKLEFLNVYFENFVRAVINKKDRASPELDESPSLIIFNIMPFHLSATLVDKIAQGLWDAIRALPSLRDIPLVFLTRNIDWFNKSAELERGIRDGKIPNKVTAIDVSPTSALW